jgi:hypothetical protein
MNTPDFDAPPDRGELQGLLRNAVDAIRAVPPPAALLAGRVGQDPGNLEYPLASSKSACDGPPLVQTPVGCEPGTNSSRPASLAGSARWKRFVRRLIGLATAAAVFAGVWIAWPRSAGRGPGTDAFAETLAQIEKAKTITWKWLSYRRFTSKDRKRTWLTTQVVAEIAYKEPGLQRYVNYDLDHPEQISTVEIVDFVHGRRLTYSPREKKATVVEGIAPDPHYRGPFSDVCEKLKIGDLQWVGKRTTAAGEVNVFRYVSSWYPNREPDQISDFWIDSKTKQLIAWYRPHVDSFDPENDPARHNPPEEKFSGQRIMCDADCEIRYDVALDDSLFRLEPPESYAVEVKKPNHVTEKEAIDYLGILADFNDKTFVDEANIVKSWSFMDKRERAVQKWAHGKPLTAVERKLLDTDMRYSPHSGVAEVGDPYFDFFFGNPDSIVAKSFRYLGKGVKLGDKDRIVCWYKLKDAKDPRTYRVVYGDLSVKDVAPKDLPLPVGP